MKPIHDISNFYFIGIGGIGMSALAIYFKKLGKNVAGYDKTPSAITQRLESIEIPIHYTDDFEGIDRVYKQKENTQVIFTPAVPSDFGELVRFRESGFSIKKRAEVLGLIANDKTCLAVAGTHGKTTTSSILGHLLAETGAAVTAFIGGITNNYDGNLIQKGNEVIVVEADEFDRSFLQLQPQIICITSMDADHLDIYKNAAALENTFKEFAAKVAPTHLFIKNGLPLEGNTVGIEDDAQYVVKNVEIREGSYFFDFIYPEGALLDLKFSLPGWHNLFNAATALGMAIAHGVLINKLPKALASYTGVNRRFTYRYQSSQKVLIDDYAHHPTEIAAVHQSVREMYPEDSVLAIFQPHLYSRTRDFMGAFGSELSKFDEVWLLDIYPAREKPIEGVSSAHLLELILGVPKKQVSKEALASEIAAASQKIVVMMGAGDIDTEILKVTQWLEDEG